MTYNNKQINNTNVDIVRSPGPVSSHSPPEGAISLPPGLIYSSTLYTPVHPLITSQLVSITVDYLGTSLPSLCLARLPTLTCVCMFTVFPVHRLRSVCALGTPALRCRLGCPVSDYCFVFACWLFIY